MVTVADYVEKRDPAALALQTRAMSVVVLVAAVLGVSLGEVPVSAAVAPVALVPAAAVDLRTLRLPNRLVGLGSVAVAVTALLESWVGIRIDDVRLFAVALGVALLAGPLLAVHLIAPAAMGFGDVKLATVLGAAIGLHEPIAALVALLIACVVGVIGGLAGRRGVIPFGPALVLGSAMALIVGEGVI